MAQSKEHDRFLEFVEFMAQTNGRDRACRTVQYGAKFLTWITQLQEGPTKTPTNAVETLQNVYAAMSMARKALRFFREPALWVSIKNGNPGGGFNELWTTLANVCLLSYFFFDHFMWAAKVKLIRWSPDTMLTLDRLTEGSWLGEVLCTLLVLFNKIRLSFEQQAKLEGEKVLDDKALRDLKAGRALLYLNLFKNLCDLPITLHFLKLAPESIPGGIYGLLGVISSLIGAWSMWPQIFKK